MMLRPHSSRASSSGARGKTSCTAAAVKSHVTRLGTCALPNALMLIEPSALGVVVMVTMGEVHCCGAHMVAMAVQPLRGTSVAPEGGGAPVCQRRHSVSAQPARRRRLRASGLLTGHTLPYCKRATRPYHIVWALRSLGGFDDEECYSMGLGDSGALRVGLRRCKPRPGRYGGRDGRCGYDASDT